MRKCVRKAKGKWGRSAEVKSGDGLGGKSVFSLTTNHRSEDWGRGGSTVNKREGVAFTKAGASKKGLGYKERWRGARGKKDLSQKSSLGERMDAKQAGRVKSRFKQKGRGVAARHHGGAGRYFAENIRWCWGFSKESKIG